MVPEMMPRCQTSEKHPLHVITLTNLFCVYKTDTFLFCRTAKLAPYTKMQSGYSLPLNITKKYMSTIVTIVSMKLNFFVIPIFCIL